MLPLPIDVSDHNPVPSNVSTLFLAGYGRARLKAAVGLGFSWAGGFDACRLVVLVSSNRMSGEDVLWGIPSADGGAGRAMHANVPGLSRYLSVRYNRAQSRNALALKPACLRLSNTCRIDQSSGNWWAELSASVRAYGESKRQSRGNANARQLHY